MIVPVVVATNNGLIRVMDPTTDITYLTVQAFNKYSKLVSVAMGDVNGDGVADIICTTRGQKNGRVKVFDGAAALQGNAVVISRFRAFSDYTGGLTVASADVNGDGHADIIVGTGKGIAGRVEVFSGAALPAASANADFVPSHLGNAITPFGKGYTLGVNVAAGDVDGDGRAEVIASAAGESEVMGFSLIGNSYIQSIATIAPFGTTGSQVVAAPMPAPEVEISISRSAASTAAAPFR